MVSGHAVSHTLDSQLQTMHRWAKVNSVSSRPLPHQISGEAPPRHGQNHSNSPLQGLRHESAKLTCRDLPQYSWT